MAYIKREVQKCGFWSIIIEIILQLILGVFWVDEFYFSIWFRKIDFLSYLEQFRRKMGNLVNKNKTGVKIDIFQFQCEVAENLNFASNLTYHQLRKIIIVVNNNWNGVKIATQFSRGNWIQFRCNILEN